MLVFQFLVGCSVFVIVSQALPSNLIVGGDPENNVDFVAYVISKHEEVEEHGFLFSGTLITRNHVLTVAQAVDDFVHWTVGVGSNFVQDLTFLETDITYKHPNFNPNTLRNNIAIIQIETHTVTENIDFPTLNREPTDQTMYMVYGFGTTNPDNIHIVPDQLQTTMQLNLDLETCREHYGNQIVNADNICTISQGAFLCGGDQGGPLMHSVGRTLFGLNSFWMSCNADFPTGYVRISSFVEWIEETINLPA